MKNKIKKVIRTMFKYTPKILSYTVTGFALCTVGVIICSLLGITIEGIARMPIYWLPVYTVGAISTSLVIYKGFDDGIDTFVASFIFGLIWPIVIIITGVVFVTKGTTALVEMLDKWSKEENEENEK